MAMTKRLRIAVLISGAGTTLKNLIDRVAAGTLGAEVRLVVSSHPRAGGLDFAREAGIPALVIESREFADTVGFSRAIFAACRDAEAELVVMGGFLKHVLIPAEFVGRVMNIHPSLIPAFCGQGFYGARVHAAVVEAGVKLSGCSVHFVDDQYDHGPLILQRAVPVHEADTPASLARRVFAVECEALPEAIELFAEGRLRIEGRRCIVDGACV